MNKRTVGAPLFGLMIGACVLIPSLAGQALAQDRRDRDHGRGPDRHYYVHDMDRWHGGHWAHERHEGRDGWWWVIGGSWYFYPAPIYPYPDPYALPMVVAPPQPLPPPVAAAPRAPAPYCREYHGDAIINGNNQPFYGTACLEQDGAWHIVN